MDSIKICVIGLSSVGLLGTHLFSMKHGRHESGVELTSFSLDTLRGKYDAVHKEFIPLDTRLALKNEDRYDVKGILNREVIDGRL